MPRTFRTDEKFIIGFPRLDTVPNQRRRPIDLPRRAETSCIWSPALIVIRIKTYRHLFLAKLHNTISTTNSLTVCVYVRNTNGNFPSLIMEIILISGADLTVKTYTTMLSNFNLLIVSPTCALKIHQSSPPRK